MSTTFITSNLDKKLPVFRTYPQKDRGAVFTVGFGGGAGFVPSSERIWDVISSHKPSAFFFMGDNVYINMPENPKNIKSVKLISSHYSFDKALLMKLYLTIDGISLFIFSNLFLVFITDL